MAEITMRGEHIELLPYTEERCLEFFKKYIPDPAMTAESYTFDADKARRYHKKVSGDRARRLFAICHEEVCIGEVSLKEVDLGAGCGTLSIAICSEEYRNRGFGTEAETLILRYAFEKLRLATVFADAVKTNRRSQHLLQKLGFRFTHQSGAFLYYRLERDAFMAR